MAGAMINPIDEATGFAVEDMGSSPKSEVNISDVIEVIDKDSNMFGPTEPTTERRQRSNAVVKIVEQPAAKALRFRYECEGRSAGSIPGVNSTAENKTFPTIKILGYQGRAVVVVSCVTKDSPYKPHPHNLVGKEGCERGVCTLRMNSDTISFSNLGIQCVKKKDIEDALRVREEIRVDPFRTGFAHRSQPSNIDLNSVRLCFQVFLEGPNKDQFTIPLKPVVSEPIYDKKAMSDLTICKLSDCSASVAGGREIILLCEKVAKEDIQIRFYEEVEGEVTWEGLAEFSPSHVHKQVAISFRTPKYRDLVVESSVKAWIQLRRPSDGATSESLRFIFTPIESDSILMYTGDRSKRKRPKTGESSPLNVLNLPHDDDSRSTYVGSLSPDPLRMLQVKPEPPESSPHYYGNSPLYPGASPGPPSPLCPPYNLQQLNVRLGVGGGLVDLNPVAAAPNIYSALPGPSNNFNNLNNPGLFARPPARTNATNSLLDMDTQNISLDLNNLDSGELTRMAMDGNMDLSENLSNSLNLSERPQDQGMTDSFTRVANNAIQELVSLSNNMYNNGAPANQ